MIKKIDRYVARKANNDKVTLVEAKNFYDDSLNEEGLILKPCLPEWAEEFRTGKIKYAKA